MSMLGLVPFAALFLSSSSCTANDVGERSSSSGGLVGLDSRCYIKNRYSHAEKVDLCPS